MKALFLTFTLLLSFYAFGQQKGANISFENESHSFGKIMESKGLVSYVYNFTNTGSEPLIIQNVQPSCGCTTPEWSNQPIVPGGKGYIKATFDPAGRPGTFTKSINVVSNAVNNMVVLKFSGEVIGKEPTVADKYPFPMDNLKFTTTYIAFGKVSPEKNVTRKIDIFNSGPNPVTMAFPNIPQHIQVIVSPSVIKPNQAAVIELTFDPKKRNDWGFVTDVVEFTQNGKKDAKYKINLSASIEDNYANATPQQLANAPKLVLEKNIFDIGRIKAGTNLEVTFKFKNLGKTNLEIRKIVSSCGCTNVKAKDTVIKPGATSDITGVFSSAGQKGAVNKTITVITNDPNNLNLVLWIRGTVE